MKYSAISPNGIHLLKNIDCIYKKILKKFIGLPFIIRQTKYSAIVLKEYICLKISTVYTRKYKKNTIQCHKSESKKNLKNVDRIYIKFTGLPFIIRQPKYSAIRLNGIHMLSTVPYV